MGALTAAARRRRFARGLPLLTSLVLGACFGAPAPRIASVSPSQLTTGEDAQLLITGTGFSPADTIQIGSAAVRQPTWVSDTVWSARLPAGLSAGAYDVAVDAPDGRKAVSRRALVVAAGAAAVSAPRPPIQPSPPLRATLPPDRAPATARPASVPATLRPTSPRFDVSGHWNLIDTVETDGAAMLAVPFANVELQQSGNSIVGSGSGITSLQGTLSGRTLTARYQAFDGSTGQFVWTFSADASAFSGSFTSSIPNHGTSVGTLVQRGV